MCVVCLVDGWRRNTGGGSEIAVVVPHYSSHYIISLVFEVVDVVDLFFSQVYRERGKETDVAKEKKKKKGTKCKEKGQKNKKAVEEEMKK